MEPIVKLPPRFVPAPATVSPVLRKLMEVRASPAPAPVGHDEWKAFATASAEDAALVGQLAAIRERHGVIVQERALAGVKCYFVSPGQTKTAHRNRLLLGFHGGAFVGGAGEAGLLEAIEVAALAGLNAIAVDYRMAPHHPFPAAVD